MKRLKNKIIIVTGGSGLIGGKIVEKIRNEGAICYNADINVKDDLNNGMIECDITNDQSIADTIKKILTKHGHLDGLVNNAYPRTTDWGNKFEDISTKSWKMNFDMQMSSIFSFCQQTLKVMKEQKSGSIINIASIYGIVGPDFTVLWLFRSKN
jgi:NAD(P)-dependent dehydrogenase (short-subunit alcohol dehydrogenase family)